MYRVIKAVTLVLLLSTIAMAPSRAADDANTVKLNFAGLDLATLARQVEKVTKKSFLFDENLLKNIKITLQSETPISSLEFYRVFQTMCQMNELALVPVEGAGIDLEKIVKSQAAFKEPGVHAVVVRGEVLPSRDQILSYLVKVQHAPASRIITSITPILSTTGSVLQVPNSDLLMINDVSSSIKRVERMLTLLDVPGEAAVSRTVHIRNLTAEKAQSMLNEYLQAFAKVGSVENGREKVAILHDERLNLLHLIGSEADVNRAQEFLSSADVDSPSAQRTIRYYKLKNVPVKDIVDYVSQLLGLALATRDKESEPQADTSAGLPPNFTPAVPPNAGPVAVAAPQSLAPSFVPKVPTNKSNRNAPLGVDIIPVDGLNTLVVAGDEHVHHEVENILKNLDRRKGQVLIEVAIIQVSCDNSRDLGIEALSVNDSSNGKKHIDFGTGFGLGTQSDSGNSSAAGGGATNLRGFPTETAISAFTGSAFRLVNEDNLQVVLRALATKSNVGIVSQPLLLVNDNETASFTTKVSQPTTTTSQGTATTNTSFSGFADATTSLKITPHISPDGYLNLEIAQTFEEFTGASEGAGIPPPKVSNNAETKISIPDRHTIIIGGFTRDASTEGKTGVPGLMQIPGLGKFFSRENKSKTLSRLYLFVRPKILLNPQFDDLNEESELKKSDVKRNSRHLDIQKEMTDKLKNDAAEVIPLDEGH
jgi:general secretion pathway protein D